MRAFNHVLLIDTQLTPPTSWNMQRSSVFNHRDSQILLDFGSHDLLLSYLPLKSSKLFVIHSCRCVDLIPCAFQIAMLLLNHSDSLEVEAPKLFLEASWRLVLRTTYSPPLPISFWYFFCWFLIMRKAISAMLLGDAESNLRGSFTETKFLFKSLANLRRPWPKVVQMARDCSSLLNLTTVFDFILKHDNYNRSEWGHKIPPLTTLDAPEIHFHQGWKLRNFLNLRSDHSVSDKSFRFALDFHL